MLCADKMEAESQKRSRAGFRRPTCASTRTLRSHSKTHRPSYVGLCNRANRKLFMVARNDPQRVNAKKQNEKKRRRRQETKQTYALCDSGNTESIPNERVRASQSKRMKINHTNDSDQETMRHNLIVKTSRNVMITISTRTRRGRRPRKANEKKQPTYESPIDKQLQRDLDPGCIAQIESDPSLSPMCDGWISE